MASQLNGQCANHANAPANTVCTRCGDFICKACVADASGGGAVCIKCENRRVGHYNDVEMVPWEDREKHGLVGGFFKTLWRIFSSPNTAFKEVAKGEGYKEPTLFIVTLGVIALVIGVMNQTILLFVDMPNPWEHFGEGAQYFQAFSWAMAILAPVMHILYAVMGGAFYHLGVAIVGSSPRGLEGTYRASAYVYVVYMLTLTLISLPLVPMQAMEGYATPGSTVNMTVSMGFSCINFGLMLYMAFLQVVAIRDVHQMSLGRSIGAAAINFVGAMLLYCIVVAAFVAIIGAGAATMFGMPPQ